MKVNWQAVGNCVKSVGGVLLCVLPVLPSFYNNGSGKQKESKIIMANHGDAVEAILNGFVLDTNKCEAVKLVKRDGDYGYYRAIINIANSSMLDSSKLEMIEAISKE